MQVMREVMLGLRRSPPATLGGRPVVRVIDRLSEDKRTRAAYSLGSGDDMITFVLSEDMRNRVTARPSGTEPKLKYYVQLYEPVRGEVQSVKGPLGEQARRVAMDVVEQSGAAIGQDLAGAESGQVEAWRAEWTRGVRRLV
jgi:phosphomannomutase